MTLQRSVKSTLFSRPSVIMIPFANSQPRIRRAKISLVMFGRKRDSPKGAPPRHLCCFLSKTIQKSFFLTFTRAKNIALEFRTKTSITFFCKKSNPWPVERWAGVATGVGPEIFWPFPLLLRLRKSFTFVSVRSSDAWDMG